MPSKPDRTDNTTSGDLTNGDSNKGAWFSDDEFWQDYAAILFSQDRWAEAPDVVSSVLALADTVKGAPVVDVCCGPGRHAIAFAQKGHPVVGVDITLPYIVAAQETATSMGLYAEFVHADARTWSRPGAFGLAVNLFTSFGYFDTRAQDEAMLARIKDNLAPGGSLVIELVGKETAVRDFTVGERFERDGRLIITEFTVVGAWEGLRHRWIIVDGDRRVDRSWVQRLYSATELRDSLLKSGFVKVDLYGSYGGAAYDHEAQRLIAVAVRSKTE